MHVTGAQLLELTRAALAARFFTSLFSFLMRSCSGRLPAQNPPGQVRLS